MPRGKKVVLDKAPEVVVPETPSIIDEIVWFSKRSCQTSRQDYKDVGITLSHHNKNNNGHKSDYYTITFAFRNNIAKILGKGNVYLQFGVVKNRIYFKIADPKIGYKLATKSGLTSYMQATCTKETKAIYEEFCPGEYHLKYDDFQELYYIEKEK